MILIQRRPASANIFYDFIINNQLSKKARVFKRNDDLEERQKCKDGDDDPLGDVCVWCQGARL